MTRRQWCCATAAVAHDTGASPLRNMVCVVQVRFGTWCVSCKSASEYGVCRASRACRACRACPLRNISQHLVFQSFVKALNLADSTSHHSNFGLVADAKEDMWHYMSARLMLYCMSEKHVSRLHIRVRQVTLHVREREREVTLHVDTMQGLHTCHITCQ